MTDDRQIHNPQSALRNPQYPLLALDVSERRIGLAITDGPTTPPQPLFTYQRTTRARDVAQCAEWVRAYHIGALVIGLPLNMDGTAGEKAQWMTRFAREVQQRVQIPVFLQDERLSTVEADELLQQAGASRQAREERVDAVAAALILQRFIEENQS